MWAIGFRALDILQEVPVGDETMNLEKLLGYSVGFMKAMGVYTLFSVMLAAIIVIGFTKYLLQLLSR